MASGTPQRLAYCTMRHDHHDWTAQYPKSRRLPMPLARSPAPPRALRCPRHGGLGERTMALGSHRPRAVDQRQHPPGAERWWAALQSESKVFVVVSDKQGQVAEVARAQAAWQPGDASGSTGR